MTTHYLVLRAVQRQAFRHCEHFCHHTATMCGVHAANTVLQVSRCLVCAPLALAAPWQAFNLQSCSHGLYMLLFAVFYWQLQDSEEIAPKIFVGGFSDLLELAKQVSTQQSLHCCHTLLLYLPLYAP
jgi:hypothetical protein